ncbi:hypothetical protein MUN82_13675 [Hymenobacter aerilatus]|uniref:PorV/PorQ family protein n=1 Tax=Hymenobacter aerilatus TaxID=2932251 RepID=A0A8T9SSK6_9BACT|nr:hypothetical protein [Hymenobacter aerilatus]UOR03994.1 hypothetical protein MUN82_13675 [Hymenobacter aerilatus]
MKKRYTLFFCLLFLGARASAQGNGPGIRGARAAALGYTSTTLHDVWAVGNNAAGLGQLTRPEVGFYAENRFLLPSFNTAALAVALPLGEVVENRPKNGVVGFEAQRFGGKLYAEQRLGAAYGYRGGQVSVGARLDVLQVSIEGLGSCRAMALSLGGQAEIVPKKLVFGAYLYNLNQARLARYQDERVPTVLRAGLGYQPTEKVLLTVETEKDVDHDADFRAGLEYQVLEVLQVRAGFAALSEQTTGGVGFRAGQLRIDYAAAWQTALGLSQYLSLHLPLTKPAQP